ncbi:hypothetical protein R83H12_02234 [Fibrobacteria bacterium R8-3-H12]
MVELARVKNETLLFPSLTATPTVLVKPSVYFLLLMGLKLLSTLKMPVPAFIIVPITVGSPLRRMPPVDAL